MGKRTNGEGSIYKRKDGRWCGAYLDSSNKRKYIYGKTKIEVKRKLQSQIDKKTTASEFLLQDWVKIFLREYKKNELKPTTYGLYLSLHRRHLQDTDLGMKRLMDIKTGDLQRYYNAKLTEGYSSKTVRGIRNILKLALQQAYKLKFIEENPDDFVTLPKKCKYHAQVLNAEEVSRIINYAKEDKLYPLIVTTLGTGMRKGEILGLTWDNVDFVRREIKVTQSICRIVNEEPDEKGHRHTIYSLMEPKTEGSIRTIPMLDAVYDALKLQEYRQHLEREKYADIYQDNRFVFADPVGNHLYKREFTDEYHNFLERHGLPEIRFHDLRHTFASLLIESDVSMKVVQDLLGHSTITTSMDLYTHVSDSKRNQVIKNLQERSVAFEPKYLSKPIEE